MTNLKKLIVCLITLITWYSQGQSNDVQTDLLAITANTKQFSQFYIDGNFKAMAEAYTVDGKLFPDGTKIIEGREAIEKRWTLPEGVSILHHSVTPTKIEIVGKTAYDYGYYQGKTLMANGSIAEWKGKYVIVWKKVDGDWKMYLDIWNRVQE